jgi:hypothetical protein
VPLEWCERFIRLFAYGSLSVVLVFYLVGLGLSEQQVGVLLTLTLVGDTVISLAITTRADRMGRRRMLIVGALLMTAAGLVFASTANLWVLLNLRPEFEIVVVQPGISKQQLNERLLEPLGATDGHLRSAGCAPLRIIASA